MTGSYGYFCQPDFQCEALLQLVLMVYQCSVHQELFWAVAYRSQTLCQLWIVEQLYTAYLFWKHLPL